MIIPDKYLQVVAHFYRGEMNRLTVYRMRLDATFQYSIVFTSALLLYFLEYKKDYYFPFLIILLNIFLCYIESRRYRYFLISQHRIHIMEKGFFTQQVLDYKKQDNWVNELQQIFTNIEFTKSILYCFMIRYFRNYIWLIDFVFILWTINLNNNLYRFVPIICIVIQHLFSFLFIPNVPDI